MKDKFNLKRKKSLQNLIIFPILCMGLLCVSCKQTLDSSKNSESELIEKINAVQHQMMVQGNISEEEELAMSSLCNLMTRDDEFDNYSPAGRILFKDIENAPIYNGCEGLSEEETKKCFNESISIFLKQEFNLSISNAIGLSEPQQVAAFFVIDENGKLTGMKIRDADVTIQSEIVRILKKIPKMKPAIQDGINVPVLCSFLLTYGSELKIELVYIPEGPSA